MWGQPSGRGSSGPSETVKEQATFGSCQSVHSLRGRTVTGVALLGPGPLGEGRVQTGPDPRCFLPQLSPLRSSGGNPASAALLVALRTVGLSNKSGQRGQVG